MAKKNQGSEDDGENTMIQIMTISLFIILLAFFILLNSIAVVDVKKQRIVVGSIVENFGGIDREEVTTGNYSEVVLQMVSALWSLKTLSQGMTDD